MKKNGYTLVELIVVIVALVIIGAITLPIILSKINNPRYESAKAKAYDIVESVKLYHYNKVKTNTLFEETIFTCDKTCKYLDEKLETNVEPSSGKITVSSDGTITGEVSFYEGDYTFYICNSILYDEKVSECLPSNDLMLKKSDYEAGEEVIYAGLVWNVVKDNGEDTTLVLKNIIDHASLGNKKYDYEQSDVNKKLKEWLENNLTLKNAKEQNKLVSMEFSDGDNDYTDYIRIPTKLEVGIRRSLDKCDTKWCNIKTAYWLINYQTSSEGIYKVYSIGEDGDAYSIDVSNECGIRPVITVKEH